jgi:hypothetical protein
MVVDKVKIMNWEYQTKNNYFQQQRSSISYNNNYSRYKILQKK